MMLPAVQHVGHRRSALLRRHEHRAGIFPGGLVVRAKQRAAWMPGGRRNLRLSGDHERLRDQRADDAGLAGARDVDPFERRVIPDVVGRVAVRDLPDDLAFIQAEGADAAVAAASRSADPERLRPPPPPSPPPPPPPAPPRPRPAAAPRATLGSICAG